jgi:hypothetical protein
MLLVARLLGIAGVPPAHQNAGRAPAIPGRSLPAEAVHPARSEAYWGIGRLMPLFVGDDVRMGNP